MKPTRRVKGLLLFPGAGSDANHPSLRAIEDAVSPLPVRRADFPYRRQGRRAPDRPPVLLASVRDEAAELASTVNAKAGSLVLGGRSMGGRMCSMAVAGSANDTALPAAGLVLISYPLHPPGKPESLRVEHLPLLTVPCLFIQGTRDTFGTRAELERWTATIPGAVTHVWIEGKGHDLKGADATISAAVADWLSGIG